jgi:hypothetical protein
MRAIEQKTQAQAACYVTADEQALLIAIVLDQGSDAESRAAPQVKGTALWLQIAPVAEKIVGSQADAPLGVVQNRELGCPRVVCYFTGSGSVKIRIRISLFWSRPGR